MQIACVEVLIPFVDAVVVVLSLHLTVYFLLLELPEICNISSYLIAICHIEFAHNFTANGKWLGHIETVKLVFVQAKPVFNHCSIA